VHDGSQWPTLRHLAEPLRGTVGLLEAVSFKEAYADVELQTLEGSKL